ncbi:uncharacterized protein LOC111082012 isoform X2 [Drosophila obscura]|uniref:uncharacterized protein LOC111082012 isoform X2 n=1 Tax=Drosophila obscura TaxID=7282 RepID=UPI001BB1539E|nr:uncharacterized protein LOC111082012 isoform X2 [Drosophila obscura]
MYNFTVAQTMKTIYALFIVLGCLISVLPFIVHAIPLPLADNDRAASNQIFVPANSTVQWKSRMVMEDLAAAADNSGYRRRELERQIMANGTWPGQDKMGLFPGVYQSKLRTAGKPTEAKPKGDVGNVSADGDDTGDAPAPGEPAPKLSPRAVSGKTRTKSLERTISIPRLQSDHIGNWVINPWGITFGVLWQDTRMNYQVKNLKTDFVFDRQYGGHYAAMYHTAQTQVCRGKSTIYNKLRVYKWLERRILSNNTQNFAVFTKYRPIWLDLRREIYTLGRSEACHVSAMDDWFLYNNCAILRNMRMEYMIPKYPLHQIGYWHEHYRKEHTY